MSNERTTDIPPALTDDDWSVREHHSRGWDGSSLVLSEFGLSAFQSAPTTKVSDLAALIALANDAMNREDPRKFGRVHVLSLRDLAGEAKDIAEIIAPRPQRDGERRLLERSAEFLNDLADLLESYLPRDPTTRPCEDQVVGPRTLRDTGRVSATDQPAAWLLGSHIR